MTEEEQALYEERAAIREYMGGMTRKEAEAAARDDVRRSFKAEKGTQLSPANGDNPA